MPNAADTKMTELTYTQWGGRKGRYERFNGAVNRSHDPFSKRPVELPKELEYECWIRVRFHLDTQTLTYRRTTVTEKVGGRLLSATATVVSTTRTTRTIFHLLRQKSERSKNVRELVAIAKAKGIELKFYSEDDLRANESLFWRLERLRQAATLHEEVGAELDDQIIRLVASGAHARSSVHRLLPGVASQLLDARLASMHCRGDLLLNLADDDFGVHLKEELT